MAPDDDKTQTYVPLTSGTMVSHYRIIEKIGAGGMGEVYLAEDTELNRKVALKFLPLHLCQDADCRARFKREAQAAAKLNHPNIVTVYEVGEFSCRPFIAMEHLEGQSLRDSIKQKDIPLSQIIEIAIQLCDGLQEAHSNGIIHRDIKPSNITCDSKGHCKILDFGLAAVHGSEQLTKTGSTLGTAGYMSPEQARGEEVDARSDLFSLGVVLYEMITGKSPFKADSEVATIKNIVDTIPEPLARYRNGLPYDLQRIVAKALAKDKAVRYQHADELAADLRQLSSARGQFPVMRSHPVRLLASLLIVVLVAAIAMKLKPWTLVYKSSDETTVQRKRIVIVPFLNRTGDPSLDPLGKIVADWTTQGLLQTSLADVIQPDMLPVSDSGKVVQQIARAIGAGTIVLGSYYLIGDSIQFQSQVLSADGSLLQAIDPAYIPRGKVMEGVELVRQRILGALMFVVDKRFEGWATQISRPPTYESYVQFTQGWDLFDIELDPARSIPYFMKAYSLDTTFIQPLINASIAFLNLGQYARTDSLIEFIELRRARLSPFQQLLVDENKAFLAGDLMNVLIAARAEVRLESNAKWLYNLAWIALRVNHPKEAVDALKKIMPDQLEQIWVNYWYILAEAYHLLGEHELELETAREGRRRFPTSAAPYIAQAHALAALKRLPELGELIEEQSTLKEVGTPAGVRRVAAEELRAHGRENEAMALLDEAIQWYETQQPEKLDSLKETYAITLYYARRWDEARRVYEQLATEILRDSVAGLRYEAYLGFIAARQGDRKRAMEASERLRNCRLPYRFGTDTYRRACIAAILGDKEQAVALLKESFLQGRGISIELHKDFDFESLWDYPPFKEILKPKG